MAEPHVLIRLIPELARTPGVSSFLVTWVSRETGRPKMDTLAANELPQPLDFPGEFERLAMDLKLPVRDENEDITRAFRAWRERHGLPPLPPEVNLNGGGTFRWNAQDRCFEGLVEVVWFNPVTDVEAAE